MHQAEEEDGRHIDSGRRSLAGAALAFFAAAAGLPAHAQGSGKRAWRLLVNEAVTGETNMFVLTSRYKPLADYLAEHAKERHAVEVEPVVDIKRFMGLARAKPHPDLVFGKSVNQVAKLVRDHGYQPIARRADPYKAAFIVLKDSPLQTLADAGRLKAKVVMPDELAATTAVARAELRRQNVAHGGEIHMKFQEVVAQQVKVGMAQVGVVNPTTARKWVEEGGRVIAETQPVANWSLVAAPEVRPEVVARLRDALLAQNGQAGSISAALGIKEWARAERDDYVALLKYTNE
jgi:ABC-type phosphate/phosphonate transport system substrate-binding protein